MNGIEDPARRLIESEQVSVRAVVVPDGEDPTPYLLKAGIVDPVAIPFTWGDDQMAARSMGNGWTDAVPATLVFDDDSDDEDGGFPQDAEFRQSPPERPAPPASASQPRTVQLPEAFGARPMAPVLRRR